ncbi:MAG: leucine-rich repeat domain-containing protein, partial [Bacteroidales bacterium]|nr:leucine-rich repeat domain-containing protein [Bacteroidales bacterium]
ITTLNIGNNVRTIPNSAFRDCSNLTSTTIPNSVTSVGDNAFYGCTRLNRVLFSSNVQTIGTQAFAECTGMRTIVFDPETPPSIESNSFDRVLRDVNVTVPCASLQAYRTAEYYDYFTNISCVNADSTASTNDTTASRIDTVYVTVHDTAYITIHDTVRITDTVYDHSTSPTQHDTVTIVNTLYDTILQTITVHDTIVSIKYDTVCPEVTDIGGVALSEVVIGVNGRQIHVEGADGLPVALYDTQGRRREMKKADMGRALQFSAPAAGVYMVRVANYPAQRVVILR